MPLTRRPILALVPPNARSHTLSMPPHRPQSISPRLLKSQISNRKFPRLSPRPTSTPRPPHRPLARGIPPVAHLHPPSSQPSPHHPAPLPRYNPPTSPRETTYQVSHTTLHPPPTSRPTLYALRLFRARQPRPKIVSAMARHIHKPADVLPRITRVR